MTSAARRWSTRAGEAREEAAGAKMAVVVEEPLEPVFLAPPPSSGSSQWENRGSDGGAALFSCIWGLRQEPVLELLLEPDKGALSCLSQVDPLYIITAHV